MNSLLKERIQYVSGVLPAMYTKNRVGYDVQWRGVKPAKLIGGVSKFVGKTGTKEWTMRIDIRVTWKKSRMYGMNPHASFRAFGDEANQYTSAKSSSTGYGYDKLSDAVARGLNLIPWLKEYLLKNEKKLSKLYGLRFFDNKGEKDVLWEGGVGVSCYRDIVEALGGEVLHVDDETWDFIRYDIPVKKKSNKKGVLSESA